MTTQTSGQQVIVHYNGMQHLLTIPQGGLRLRLQVEGERLNATFEADGAKQPGLSLQIITWALERLAIDPVVDPHNPFHPYHRGQMLSAPLPAERVASVEQAESDG